MIFSSSIRSAYPILPSSSSAARIAAESCFELAFGGATFAASDLYVGADGGTRFDVTPAAPVSMRPPLSGSTLTEEEVANSVNAKAFSCCGANVHITSVYLPGSAPDSSADTSCVPCANFDAATCRGACSSYDPVISAPSPLKSRKPTAGASSAACACSAAAWSASPAAAASAAAWVSCACCFESSSDSSGRSESERTPTRSAAAGSVIAYCGFWNHVSG